MKMSLRVGKQPVQEPWVMNQTDTKINYSLLLTNCNTVAYING